MSAVYAGVLSRADQRFLIGWSSTNLDNLDTRPVSTMVVSAFVSEDPFIVWAIATSLGLWLLVRRFGNLRAAVLVATAHVVGTLISEGIAYWRVTAGQVPAAIRHIADVGPSYVTVAALFAVVLYGRRAWKRMAALTCWLMLAPFLFEGLGSLEVAAVGHLAATLAGALIGGCYLLHERKVLRLDGDTDQAGELLARVLDVASTPFGRADEARLHKVEAVVEAQDLGAGAST